MTTQNPDGRYIVYSVHNYHRPSPDVVPAARYDLLSDAIAHAESVTYKMAVSDSQSESRLLVYCNWEKESARTTKFFNDRHDARVAAGNQSLYKD